MDYKHKKLTKNRKIISGHRRWQALKKLGVNNIRCEIRTFTDALDEQETLIECNRQRKKSPSQIYNEMKILEKIIKDRAEIRRLANLRNNSANNVEAANLPDREKVGDTREILAQKVGVPQKKLETILEVGKLAETGKTRAERDEEENNNHKTPKTFKN